MQTIIHFHSSFVDMRNLKIYPGSYTNSPSFIVRVLLPFLKQEKSSPLRTPLLYAVWQGGCYLANYAGITFCCVFCR